MITHLLYWDCCGGKWVRKSDYLVSDGNMSQHSRALIHLNSIQWTNILKVVCLSSGWQTWCSVQSSDFLHHNLVISAPSDLFIESDHSEFWAHNDVVKHLNSLYVYSQLRSGHRAALHASRRWVLPSSVLCHPTHSLHVGSQSTRRTCVHPAGSMNLLRTGWLDEKLYESMDCWSSKMNKWRELLLFIFHFMV